MRRLPQRCVTVCAVAAFSGILAFPVWAQEFLPPPELAMSAIAAYAEVRAAGAAVEQAHEQARVLEAGPYDTELSVNPQRRRVDDVPGRSGYTEWEVQLSRTIRLPEKAGLDRQAGVHGIAAAGFRRGDVMHQAARGLLAAWMGWLRADAAAATAQAQSESLARERDTIARRLELGDAAQRELDQIMAALAMAQAGLSQAQAQARTQRLTLAADYPQIPVPARAPTLPEPAPLEGPPQGWIDRIASVSQAAGALDENAARYDVLGRRAQADRRADPTIGVRAFDERGGAEHGLGVVLTIPFGMERRDAQALAALAAAAEARSQADAMRRDVLREARISIARAQSGIELWQAARDARTASAASLARQRKAYELGEIGLAERLQAERLDAEAALAELSARAEAHEARLRVRLDSYDLWLPGLAAGSGRW